VSSTIKEIHCEAAKLRANGMFLTANEKLLTSDKLRLSEEAVLNILPAYLRPPRPPTQSNEDWDDTAFPSMDGEFVGFPSSFDFDEEDPMFRIRNAIQAV
jgi:hypothetical protein